MSRKKIIAGNWKMNCGIPADAVKLIEELKPLVKDATAKIALGVPATALAAAVEATAYTNIKIAAQNCHFEEKGAFTGEISPLWLAKMGVTYCIIGHSERRTYYNETNEACALKAKRLFQDNIVPILCIGETEAEYDAGQTADVIKAQLTGSLAGLDASEVARMVIAYEPIWAIGTGKTATNEIAEDVCGYIRSVVKDLYGEDTAEKVRIQYGGSVKPEGLKALLEQPDIDGALVGGLGEAILSYKNSKWASSNTVIKTVGIPDQFVTHGNVDELFSECGITTDILEEFFV